MSLSHEKLNQLLTEIAEEMQEKADLEPLYYAHLLRDPGVASVLIDIINALHEDVVFDEAHTYYSACMFALDLCVAQLQSAHEQGQTLAYLTLTDLMSKIALCMRTSQHSLSFWLPILHAFYDVHVDLSTDIKQAYMDLAYAEEPSISEDDAAYLNALRELILELSDLSVFDIAEHFFAQSYAMPPEFFADLFLDLYQLDEGHDVALLFLLHPDPTVRALIFQTMDGWIPHVRLSSMSLSRLKAIARWYPQDAQATFSRWIKLQRHLGVIFTPNAPASIVRLKASEIDGGGAQGIFIHLKKNRQHQLAGLLLKSTLGIKDVWVTQRISVRDATQSYQEAFNDSIMLRDVDLGYLDLITNHCLAVTLEKGQLPDLHLLEMQEALGHVFVPQKINPADLLTSIGIKIHPFTQERISLAYKRTRSWVKTKSFTESWFLENVNVDHIVNRHCIYVHGVKTCQFQQALHDVLEDEMETHRDQWLFHFLWVALWLKACCRPKEHQWEDSFLIAHSIHEGVPLKAIPLFHEMAYQSVMNSIETMQERRTHLERVIPES